MPYFDAFPGTTVDEKMRAMNAWHAGLGSNTPREAVIFAPAVYAHSVPIDLRSGMTLLGGKRGAAREYGTGTVLRYTGTVSQLAFVANRQGYPADGSPRDMTYDSIQWSGNAGVDWMPRFDPSRDSYSSRVIWMSRFHDCGWVGFRSFWWGWSDGSVIDGVTHCQGYSDTPFYLGGSETALFGSDGFSFMDSRAPGWPEAGKPTIRTRLTKSSIGRVMVTARRTAYQLLIDGGGALDVDGFYADAQDSDPVYGAAVRITGGDGIVLRGCCIKGAMVAPDKAAGLAAGNGGWVHVAGGSQVAVDGCRFVLAAGGPLPAVPLLYVAPGLPAGAVRWGPSNVTYGFRGTPCVVASGPAAAPPPPPPTTTRK
jgi:hypothetical protein